MSNRLLRLPHAGALASLFEQALVSLCTFAATVLLARTLDPESFGSYVLINAVASSLLGAQSALLLVPHRVFAAVPAEEGRLIRTSLKLQLSGAAALAAAGSSAFSVLSANKDLSVPAHSSVLAYFFLSSLVEFLRTVYSTRQSWAGLLAVSFTGHVSKLISMAIAALLLTPTLSTSVLSALPSMFVASCLGCFLWAKNQHETAVLSVGTLARRHWRYGKWLLCENLAFIASNQYFLFVLAAQLGPSETANFGAAQQLTNVFNVFLIGLSSYGLSAAHREYLAHGFLKWKNLILGGSLVLVLSAATLGAICVFWAHEGVLLIYGPNYTLASELIPWFSAIIIINAANSAFSVAFRTTRLPKIGTIARIVSALFALVFGTHLIGRFGAAGAAAGLLISQTIWLAIYIYFGVGRKLLTHAEVTGRMAKEE